MSKPIAAWTKPDYGVDVPHVIRNLYIFGTLSWLLVLATPRVWHLGSLDLELHRPLASVGTVLLVEALLMTMYVKYGKFRHRDFILSLYPWKGDEKVLDVGCGRGLLLAGAAKKLTTGHATGIDHWSNVDMGANSAAASQRNLELDGVDSRCSLVTAGAEAMPFDDAAFDVIVSNLCVHNIYDRPTRTKALQEIVRVLKPGGMALISDFKHTGQYAAEFASAGLTVERRWGNVLTTFPPLRVVVARKP